MLMLAEGLNKAPGRYRSTEAAFDNLAISLSDFSLVAKDSKAQPMPATDERFANRTITLREKPYMPADEMDQFVTRSFA